MFIRHIPTRVTSLNNFSVDFESASSQYASITDATQTGLDITGDITIECWYKPESNPDAGGHTFVAKADFVLNQRAYWLSYYDDAGTKKLRFVVSSDGGNINQDVLVVTQNLTLDTWFHIAVTWDASASTAKFYINGTQTGGDQTGSETSIYNSSAPFSIGALSNNSVYERFADGLINNLRIWNVVRTQTQINNSKGVVFTSGTGLVSSWYAINNNHNDLTATGNDLTATNSPTFSADTPF